MTRRDQRKLRLCLGLLVGVFAAANFSACGTGTIYDSTSQASKTFNELSGSETDDTGHQQQGDDDGAGDDVQGGLDFSISTKATCHPGEIDVAKSLIQPDPVDPIFGLVEGNEKTIGKELLLTLEAKGGVVLGSVTVALAELLLQDPQAAKNTIQELKRNMPVVVPASLAGKETFPASIFLCIDTTENGSCSDEKVDDLNARIFMGGRAAPVIFHRGVAVDVKNMAIVALSIEDQWAELFGKEWLDQMDPEWKKFMEAAGFMENLLQNLPADDLRNIILAQKVEDPTCTLFEDRGGGCFVAGTKIQVEKGVFKNVEEIYKGVNVLTRDGKVAKVQRAVAGPEKEPVIAIKTRAGQNLTVTSKHPMLTRSGLKTAENLSAKDELMTATGEFTGLTSLMFLPYDGKVYNFELAGEEHGDHLVVAEGVVTGDLCLQEKLSAAADLVAKRK